MMMLHIFQRKTELKKKKGNILCKTKAIAYSQIWQWQNSMSMTGKAVALMATGYDSARLVTSMFCIHPFLAQSTYPQTHVNKISRLMQLMRLLAMIAHKI